MNSLVELLLEHCEKDFFTSDYIQLLLPDYTSDARYSLVKRALKSGELVVLRRGLYLIGEKYRRGKISHNTLANHIYAPSYVSFESALSFYGVIPDIIQNSISASYKRSSEINSPAPLVCSNILQYL